MDIKKLFGYEGKKVIVAGGSSGMGLAAVEMLLELGAKVTVLDLKECPKPVEKMIITNMLKKDSIDAAIQQLPEKIDRLFVCHGMAAFPGRDIDVVMCNFVSQRYLDDALLPRIPDFGAICHIASFGGYGWQRSWQKVTKMLNTKTWDEAYDWLKANEKDIPDPDAYSFSKKCLVGYVKSSAWKPELLDRRIRINAISPGLTRTGLTPDFNKASEMQGGGEAVIERIFLGGWKGRYATPEEMGYPMVFLNSDMCSYITGQDLNISFGLDAVTDIQILNQAAEASPVNSEVHKK